MDALFDLLLLIAAMSILYGAMGILAGIADKSYPIRRWVWRVVTGGN